MALIIVPDDQPNIVAGVGAAVDGDAVWVRAGTYAESVVINGKDIELVGIGDSPEDVIIAPAAGMAVQVTGCTALIADLTVQPVAGSYGVWVANTAQMTKMRNVIADGQGRANTYGFSLGNWDITAENCLAYDCNIGFYSNGWGQFYHCTAVDNLAFGFQGVAASRLYCVACLASNNGVDFNNATVAACAFNVSSDLTAPGGGSRTGFDNANFVDYAGDNFRLIYPQGANGAEYAGTSWVDLDAYGNTRSRTTGVFYTGYHDPYVAPAGSAPTCLGIIDAQPWAQGCLLVRFYEMFCDEETVPYRYDFHVKRLDSGILTEAEINAGTYFSCAFYNEEVNAGGAGSPFPSPAELSVVLALESPGDIGDNIHLMTNRQYQIAVRVVAIDVNNVIYEDDNYVLALSWSTGYQGITHQIILDWPCLELCADNPVQRVRITSVDSLPTVNAAITSLPPLELAVQRMPNLNVNLDVRGRGRG